MTKLLTMTVLAASIFTCVMPLAEAKKARSNDLVDEYELLDNSRLVRKIGDQTCDVTTKVKSFKVSQHPKDAAMIYYVKKNDQGGDDLYYLRNASNAVRKDGQCPKADKHLLMKNVKEYTVVPSENTEIVNMALGQDGRLLAWANSGTPLIDQNGIKDLAMNSCNDQAGFSFKKYVAFAESRDGRILKVEGDRPSDSAFTPEQFDNISDFKAKQKVCVNNNQSRNQGGRASLDAQ